jgi:predicted DCC family thiol-disulfide oxidoreductase YuxK
MADVAAAAATDAQIQEATALSLEVVRAVVACCLTMGAFVPPECLGGERHVGAVQRVLRDVLQDTAAFLTRAGAPLTEAHRQHGRQALLHWLQQPAQAPLWTPLRAEPWLHATLLQTLARWVHGDDANTVAALRVHLLDMRRRNQFVVVAYVAGDASADLQTEAVLYGAALGTVTSDGYVALQDALLAERVFGRGLARDRQALRAVLDAVRQLAMPLCLAAARGLAPL